MNADGTGVADGPYAVWRVACDRCQNTMYLPLDGRQTKCKCGSVYQAVVNVYASRPKEEDRLVDNQGPSK